MKKLLFVLSISVLFDLTAQFTCDDGCYNSPPSSCDYFYDGQCYCCN